MENLTGGTPPVRYLPCVVPCKLYFWQIKIPFYEIPVLGHSPFSIYKSTIRCYAEIILRLKVSSDPEEYKNSIITMWSISQKRFRRLLRQSEILYKKG